MNPLEMLKAIKNPKEYVMNQLGNINNPILNNMVQLAEQGKTKEVETIARNICQTKGIDFDKDILPMLNKLK